MKALSKLKLKVSIQGNYPDYYWKILNPEMVGLYSMASIGNFVDVEYTKRDIKNFMRRNKFNYEIVGNRR